MKKLNGPVLSHAACPQAPAGARGTEKLPGHGAKSEAVRERAIVSLLSEKTLAEAARRCGVNEKTLRRWMASDEAFKQALTEMRRTLFEAAINRIEGLAGVAVDTLETLMSSKVPPNVRLGAARTVAELAFHQHDAETIMHRLYDVEARQRELDTLERS